MKELLIKYGLSEHEADVFIELSKKLKPTQEDINIYEETIEKGNLGEGGFLAHEILIILSDEIQE